MKIFLEKQTMGHQSEVAKSYCNSVKKSIYDRKQFFNQYMKELTFCQYFVVCISCYFLFDNPYKVS